MPLLIPGLFVSLGTQNRAGTAPSLSTDAFYTETWRACSRPEALVTVTGLLLKRNAVPVLLAAGSCCGQSRRGRQPCIDRSALLFLSSVPCQLDLTSNLSTQQPYNPSCIAPVFHLNIHSISVYHQYHETLWGPGSSLSFARASTAFCPLASVWAQQGFCQHRDGHFALRSLC